MKNPHDHYDIASTIWKLLGGRQFSAVTGARHFSVVPHGISFQLPFAPAGLNGITITQAGPNQNAYVVEFVRILHKAPWRTVLGKILVVGDSLRQEIETAIQMLTENLPTPNPEKENT